MNRIVIDEDKCICCGLGIPEGLQVCPACEREAAQKEVNNLDKSDTKIKAGGGKRCGGK